MFTTYANAPRIKLTNFPSRYLLILSVPDENFSWKRQVRTTFDIYGVFFTFLLRKISNYFALRVSVINFINQKTGHENTMF